MKLVCVNESPKTRQGLIAILKLKYNFEFVGQAASVEEAIRVISKSHPDLVILDVKLKDQSGLNIPGEMEKMNIHCKYLVFTSSLNPDDFLKAIELGIDGYILKEDIPEEIINAIRLVMRGRKYYDPSVIEWIIAKRNWYEERLTKREREVLLTLEAGLSNKDIAAKLHITEYTVKKHVSRILAKLGLSCRTQAALYSQALYKRTHSPNN